jgi:hypothetical protein
LGILHLHWLFGAIKVHVKKLYSGIKKRKNIDSGQLLHKANAFSSSNEIKAILKNNEAVNYQLRPYLLFARGFKAHKTLHQALSRDINEVSCQWHRRGVPNFTDQN